MPTVGTYTATYSASRTLTASPATITSTGQFAVATDYSIAVTGTLTGQVLSNYGLVNESGSYGIGVELTGSGSVANFGTVEGTGNRGTGVELLSAGQVVNGSAGHPGALISGEIGLALAGTISADTVINYGVITGTGAFAADAGIYVVGGANVTSGSAIGTIFNAGTVTGNSGIALLDVYATNTVVNHGTVIGTGTALVDSGVYLAGTATVINGSTSATGALIEGNYGVRMSGANATLENFGTIDGNTAADYAGVFMGSPDGDHVINGSATDIVALIQGYDGVDAYGTVTNFGRILGNLNGVDDSIGYNNPVGVVTNGSTADTSALISGFHGVVMYGGTVTNFGTIAGTSGDSYSSGALFRSSGKLINGSATSTAALISGGGYGVQMLGALGTVVNFGRIEESNAAASYSAVDMLYRGVVTNGSSADVNALIKGYEAVTFAEAGTVTNFGTIDGSGGTAVALAGGKVVDEGHGVFVGTVAGGGGTLEFATADGSGTVSGIGAQFTGFTKVNVDTGANWTFSGANTIAYGYTLTNHGVITVTNGSLTDAGTLAGAGTIVVGSGGTAILQGPAAGTIEFGGGNLVELQEPAGVTIGGFTIGDTIDLTGFEFGYNGVVTENAGHLLTIVEHSVTATVQLSAAYSGVSFHLAPDNVDFGTAITLEPTCFCRGTRILTDRGEVAVEDLDLGDMVVAHVGWKPVLKPIKWLGSRRLGMPYRKLPETVSPIRIRAHAFAENVPHRDLLVSPGHAIYVDGILIPAFRLVNGITVVRETNWRTVEYWHVELDEHDVLLSEGLTTETYLDNGNRSFFQNGGDAVALHALPDGVPPEEGFCAPWRERGPQVVGARRRLIKRAAALGYVTTNMPELRLEADGLVVHPASVDGAVYRFAVPAHKTPFRLVSAAAPPSDTQPDNLDERPLGVAVSRIRSGNREQPLANDAMFAQGWHALECEDGRRWRWTNGDAALPPVGPGIIEVTVHMAVERWADAEELSVAGTARR